MAVTVADSATGRTLATGVLPAGYADNHPAPARVYPAVRTGTFIDACVRNVGATAPPHTAPPTTRT